MLRPAAPERVGAAGGRRGRDCRPRWTCPSPTPPPTPGRACPGGSGALPGGPAKEGGEPKAARRSSRRPREESGRLGLGDPLSEGSLRPGNAAGKGGPSRGRAARPGGKLLSHPRPPWDAPSQKRPEPPRPRPGSWLLGSRAPRAGGHLPACPPRTHLRRRRPLPAARVPGPAGSRRGRRVRSGRRAWPSPRSAAWPWPWARDLLGGSAPRLPRLPRLRVAPPPPLPPAGQRLSRLGKLRSANLGHPSPGGRPEEVGSLPRGPGLPQSPEARVPFASPRAGGRGAARKGAQLTPPYTREGCSQRGSFIQGAPSHSWPRPQAAS